MKTNKTIEIALIVVLVFSSLHFLILPGLSSENSIVNFISLTSFFFLVVLVAFGANLFKKDDEN